MARRSMRFTTALVTGASSGIGLEISRLLAERGTSLVLVARSADRLETLAKELERDHGVDAEVLAADLCEPTAVEGVADRIASAERPVDLVVNNAGFGVYGKFGEVDWAEEERMLTLNVIALTRLSHAAVRAMGPRGRGGILNVSSIGAFLPSYAYGTYGASKSYVLSFTEVLHEELRPSGVHVTCLAPGFTRTEFQARSGNEAEGIPGFLWQTAREVAESGVDGVAANRALVVPGALYKATVGLTKVTPRAVARRVSGPVVERF